MTDQFLERLQKAYYVCDTCGRKYGNGPADTVSTWSDSICDICLELKGTTGFRHFGNLKDEFAYVPKFKVGDMVANPRNPKTSIVRVLEIAKHGKGNCGCCPDAKHIYFMYRISGISWINEDQLVLANI
jgi:hypothetical protein